MSPLYNEDDKRAQGGPRGWQVRVKDWAGGSCSPAGDHPTGLPSTRIPRPATPTGLSEWVTAWLQTPSQEAMAFTGHRGQQGDLASRGDGTSYPSPSTRAASSSGVDWKGQDSFLGTHLHPAPDVRVTLGEKL